MNKKLSFQVRMTYHVIWQHKHAVNTSLYASVFHRLAGRQEKQGLLMPNSMIGLLTLV